MPTPYFCAPRAHTQLPACLLALSCGAARKQPEPCEQAAHLDRLRGIHCDLVVCGVAVLDAQVKVLDVQVQVGQDELRPAPPAISRNSSSRHAERCTLCETSARAVASLLRPTLFLISVQITLLAPDTAVSC